MKKLKKKRKQRRKAARLKRRAIAGRLYPGGPKVNKDGVPGGGADAL